MTKYRIVKVINKRLGVVYRVQIRVLFFFWSEMWVSFSNQKQAEEYIDKLHCHDSPDKSVKIIPYDPKS